MDKEMREDDPSVFKVVKMKSGHPIRAYKRFSGEIGAEIEKADFIAAIVEEFGSPTFVFTRAQFQQRLSEAIDKVQKSLQQSTASVASEKIYRDRV